MWNEERLSILELSVLNHLRTVGYEASICLRIHFRINRDRVNKILQNLFKGGFINRDIQGLVISEEWLAKNPDSIPWLQRTFKISFI